MGKLELDRRKFLKTIFLSSICGGLPTSILANNNQHNFNYLQINFAGGPARWLFDNPIVPKKNSGYVPHPMIVNSFENPGAIAKISSLKYRTTNISGWQMPLFWDDNLKLETGNVKASNLLDNALIVRGCHMRNDGHSLNNRKLSAPVPGHESIPGLLADKQKNKLFPSVNIIGDSGVAGVAAGTFKGSGQAVQIDIPQNHDEPLKHLLDPYLSLKSISDKWGSIVNEELGSSSKRDFNKIVNDYNKAVKKYKATISYALRVEEYNNIGERVVAGIDLNKIKGGKFDLHEAKYLNHEYLMCNSDIRTILKTAKVEKLAEQFACTEILLVENLSGNICINVNTITNLFYENSYKKSLVGRKINGVGNTEFNFNATGKSYTGSSKDNSFQLDSHDTGLLANLFLNHALYKVVVSCISELKLSLEKNNIYNKTLIHLASEFDRDPRPDCSGSEHGWNGHISSFYSGAIKGLKVIGNTYVQSNGESYYQTNGTWGQGAPVKELGGRPIVYGNIASSLADILGVESPAKNDKPIFYKKAGRIKTEIDEVENV